MLSVGLLGLAALMPIGRYTIGEAIKADHAGDCGRAALRDVIVRRMLDSNNWSGNAGNGAFVIDPLWASQRTRHRSAACRVVSLGNVNPQSFQATDDLIVTLPENMNPKQPVGRPINLMVNGQSDRAALDGQRRFLLVPDGRFRANTPNRFTVSVVVCLKRDGTQQTASVSSFPDGGSAGGSVQLTAAHDAEENDWIALCGGGLCYWYRVAALDDNGQY